MPKSTSDNVHTAISRRASPRSLGT